MRVYHDWEFLEDGSTIAPISLGMVAEDGRELYAVFADMPVKEITGHDWLMANVVPSLPFVRHDGIKPFCKPFLDCAHPDVKKRDVIQSEVRDFLLATPNLELWGWYSAYDHVCLAQLFGRMIDLPDGVPMWTNDLRQDVQRLGIDESDLPQQAAGHHNALADARHYLKIAAHLAEVERAGAEGER